MDKGLSNDIWSTSTHSIIFSYNLECIGLVQLWIAYFLCHERTCIDLDSDKLKQKIAYKMLNGFEYKYEYEAIMAKLYETFIHLFLSIIFI